MNIKEYSKKLAAELVKHFEKVNVKEVKGEGEFKVIATTSSVDRDGESILVEGWDFENFMKNPIILFGHNYWEMDCIIGAATKVYIEGVQVIVEGIFAATEAGQYVRKLYDDGILKTVSVGFIPKERQGNVITKAELLEVSFVPVPANPEALSMAKAMQAVHEFEKKFFKKNNEDEEEEKKEEKAGEKGLLLSSEKIKQLKSDLGAIVDAYILEATLAPAGKAGRVISAKNETLIKTAIAACDAVIKPLQELLAAVTEEEGKGANTELRQLTEFLKGADKLIEKALINVKAQKNNS